MTTEPLCGVHWTKVLLNAETEEMVTWAPWVSTDTKVAAAPSSNRHESNSLV